MKPDSASVNRSKELESDFSWIPAGDVRGRRLRDNAKTAFDQRLTLQPFRRSGSLPLSVERHIDLDNSAVTAPTRWSRGGLTKNAQRDIAKEEARFASFKQILRNGGGALRGPVTQSASFDNLERRYFEDASRTLSTKDMASEHVPVDDGEPRELDSKVCHRCRGANAENLSGGRSYTHSTLHRLASSRTTCRLCRLIWELMGISSLDVTLARYRILLTVNERSPYLDLQNRCVSIEDHTADTRNHLSEMIVHLQDLMPFLPSECDLFEYDRADTVDHRAGTVERPWPLTETNVPSGREESDARSLDPMIVREESGLLCFTEEGDPARNLITGISWVRSLGSTTSSESSLKVARMWLRRCVAEEDCLASNFATDDHRELTYSPPSSPSLLFPFADDGTFIAESLDSRNNRTESDESFETPSRLLKIDDDVTSIKLVETNGQEIPYAALSYCWGKDDVGGWKTTMASLESHKNVGLHISTLPKTLKHSLEITRSLDISYIWIDALCIIQDSSEDWAKEAAKMAGVYFGSVVTIAASGARSWTDGCFNTNSRRVFERGSYSNCIAAVDSELSTGDISRLYILSTEALRHGEDTDTYFHGAWERYHGVFSGVAYSRLVLDSPLAKRGWTFQEHRLPRRTLYFTAEQLFWECQHCRMGEDNFPMKQKLGGHPILDSKHVTSDEAARLWYLGVVEDYSRRQLTYSTDKLVAVSALAKSAYRRRPQPYIAGLWKDSILHGLMWRRDGQGTKHAFQSCPSWSWATQNSAIQYLWTNPGVNHATSWLVQYQPRIERVSWAPSLVNPFADVLSASIIIRTLTRSGTVLHHSHRRKGGQNSQGTTGWSGHASLEEVRYEYADGGYKPAAKLEQGLYISSATTQTIWYMEAVLDDSSDLHRNVLVAFLGVDNDDTSAIHEFEPGQNNNNLVFLLLHPSDPNAEAHRRVGIARFRSTWVRPTKGDIWRLRDDIKEHPLTGWEEKTLCLV